MRKQVDTSFIVQFEVEERIYKRYARRMTVYIRNLLWASIRHKIHLYERLVIR